MIKNRFFSVVAAAALVGFAACQAEEPAEDVVVEEPVAEQPAGELPVEAAPVVIDSAAPAVEGAEAAPATVEGEVPAAEGHL